jgi:AcrR family transcriptional regulator
VRDPTQAAPRPGADDQLRSDARRNRTRILEVAEQVFADKGPQASTEEVAVAAGVGIGTVFRHFPTKAALLEGVVLSKIRRLIDEAEALSTSEDPNAALFAFFSRMVAGSPSKRAFSDALAEAGVDLKSATAELKQELGRAIGKLLSNAQRAGTVRKDVGVPELMALMSGAFHAAEHGTDCSETACRVLDIIFDGLRAEGAKERRSPRKGRTPRG